ncbi:MAG: hypothetical protein N3G20_08645, partial [Verrucomicrobiae bacterium]|nr:hypothetical protein [Verrucomicrobiae bacterium]
CIRDSYKDPHRCASSTARWANNAIPNALKNMPLGTTNTQQKYHIGSTLAFRSVFPKAVIVHRTLGITCSHCLVGKPSPVRRPSWLWRSDHAKTSRVGFLINRKVNFSQGLAEAGRIVHISQF